MAIEAVLTLEELESLRKLSSCQIADAIETFDVRLRNEGFMDSSVRCMFPTLLPIVGYAVTARFRTSEPPMTGTGYLDRTDWWNYLLTIPAPRVIVLEDLDRYPGFGSCAGEVHAHIFKALGCAGLVTNGAVRDLEAAESISFRFFAGLLFFRCLLFLGQQVLLLFFQRRTPVDVSLPIEINLAVDQCFLHHRVHAERIAIENGQIRIFAHIN